MKANKKTTTTLILLMALLLIVSACGSASGTTGQQPQVQEQPQAQPQEQTIEAAATSENNPGNAQNIGEGATVFKFEVTDSNEKISVWNVHTDEETVGAALLEAGLISGDESEMGLMVIYVNGERADFAEDGAWWALYIDGEMAMAGVDSIDIEEGVTYAFIYSPA